MMPHKQVTLTRWKVVGAFIVLCLSFVFSLFMVNREAQKRSEATELLVMEINRHRADITYTTCLDQNARNTNTVLQLDNLIIRRKAALRQAIKDSDTLAEAEALRAQMDALDDGRATTVSLIDALQPHQNCEQITLDRFGFVPNLKEE